MPNNFDKIISLAQQKNEVLSDIYELTQLHSGLITADDFEKLNASLEKRQQLILQITDISKRINIIKNKYFKNEKKTRLDSLEQEALKILKNIRLADSKSTSAIKSRMLKIKNNIKNGNMNKRGFVAYNLANYGGQSLYFDKRDVE
ncbi:MAG: hypothetical protein M0R40_06645 [Firmicutes bacterium]|nr:hypothetical protein [Bacillota bacterium]